MKRSKKAYYTIRYIIRSKYVPEVAIQAFKTLKEAKEYFKKHIDNKNEYEIYDLQLRKVALK
jgi:hypothetical protein